MDQYPYGLELCTLVVGLSRFFFKFLKIQSLVYDDLLSKYPNDSSIFTLEEAVADELSREVELKRSRKGSNIGQTSRNVVQVPNFKGSEVINSEKFSKLLGELPEYRPDSADYSDLFSRSSERKVRRIALERWGFRNWKHALEVGAVQGVGVRCIDPLDSRPQYFVIKTD